MPLLVDSVLPAGSLSRAKQPILEVEGGLLLRPWQVTDAAAVCEAYACQDIQQWHARSMDSDDEAREWIQRWSKGWAEETAASWAIVDGELMGQVGLRNISMFEGRAALSYWMLPAGRGKGAAAKAVEALTQWAFGAIGFHRFSLQHSTHNQPSCRVAAKAGFALEGTLRSVALHADGWHDMHLHARVNAG